MSGRAHGTRARYVINRCRCPRCSQANREYQARLNRAKAYGRWQPFVDAEPVREHVRTLMDAGIGRRQIASASGVGLTTVGSLLYGRGKRPPTRRLREEVAERLLAVTAEDRAPGALIDALGTRRRLQALMAFGWPARTLAERLGTTATGIQIAQTDFVTVATAEKVRRLYEELQMVPGPRPDLGERYRRVGYLVPAWWDDDRIDDPSHLPNLAADMPNAEERERRAALRDAAAQLRVAGLGPAVIADRLSADRKDVLAACRWAERAQGAFDFGLEEATTSARRSA